MQPLVYHVAATLDGFIAKADGQVPGFAMEGDHADAYVAQLAEYAAIVMGRATYEVGYRYGMRPGDLPYGDRPHYIFSSGIELPGAPNLHVIREEALAHIDHIKEQAAGPIYLCGGGRFAGFLLANSRVDCLRIKLNPVVYGMGIRRFEGFDGIQEFVLTRVDRYRSGIVLMYYDRH